MNGSNRFITLKVLLFMFVVVGIFTYYANSIPQIESRPPQELVLTREELTPEALVQAGKDIFYGKGTCAICHAIGEKGARAPDLAGIGAKATERVPGKSAKEYLIESLTDPAAYIVEGYPPIMQDVTKPPISLNQTEVLATVAFLQSLGGVVDIKPEDLPAEVPDTAAVTEVQPLKLPGDPQAGKAVAAACIPCHVIEGVGKPRRPRAPDLSAIGAISTPEYIIESILDPDAVVVAGYRPGLMPKDFGQKLTAQEFVDLVAFLSNLKGGSVEDGEEGKPADQEAEKQPAAEGIESKSGGSTEGTKAPETVGTDVKPAESEKQEGIQEIQAPATGDTEVKPAEDEDQEGAEVQGGTSETPTEETNPQE